MKLDFFRFNYFLTEAVKRIGHVLEEYEAEDAEDVELDGCIVNKKLLEKLYSDCKSGLNGQAADLKIPLELIVMDDFWREFSVFVRNN